MTRYFFHLNFSSFIRDEVGDVFPDSDAARSHAETIALELMQGGESKHARVVVMDAADQVLFEVPMPDIDLPDDGGA